MFSSWAKSLIRQMAREAAKNEAVKRAAQKRLKELAAEAAKKEKV
ncbi:hypothetical protein ACFU76_28385 [Streptomyces sp. NPDC057539]